jgi:hypothetical protein
MVEKTGDRNGIGKTSLGNVIVGERRSIHVAEQVGMAQRHVRKWAKRYVGEGINGLYDKPRPGRKPVFPR